MHSREPEETPQTPTPPVGVQPITPEEAERRRVLAEQAARKYVRWRPWLAPGGPPKNLEGLLATFNPFLTVASFALFVGVEGLQFGWPMGIGIGLVILIHEIGHAVAALMKRIPVTGIILIPFVGGIAMRARRGETATEDAFIGIMGPVFGVAAGIVCAALYPLTGQPVFLSIAQLVFLIHLLNLLPIPGLDGSRLVPLFKRPKREAYQPYYRRVTDADRRTYGLIYGGLALLCIAGFLLIKWQGIDP